MAQPRILIIEDERGLTQSLSWYFKREGYEVTVADDGLEGLRLAQAAPPDVVLLDLMLPGMNGLDVCRELRAGERTRDVPIIMVTAKAEEADVVVGYSLGADDYVGMPFSNKVLLGKVKALLRRAEGARRAVADGAVEHRGARVDRVRHRATLGGTPLDLTPTEFRLLEMLVRRPGRRELADATVGDGSMVPERTIDVHVKTLRRKLARAGGPHALIETVRGVGYRFGEEPPGAK